MEPRQPGRDTDQSIGPDCDHNIDPQTWLPVRRLWVGALCAVDEVVLRDTGQRAVLKHLHVEHLADPSLAARCLNEALILRLVHQEGAVVRIPRLLKAGFLPSGCPGLLIELLGTSLAACLHSPSWATYNQQQTYAAVLRIGLHSAQTLLHLHARALVHRDVRPENILFGQNQPAGVPAADTYLIDFGLAKTTGRADTLPISTGEQDFVGTDEYMAPEQWESAKQVTGAADVYSLGIVLYRLASGRLPFGDARRQVLFYQHLVKPPAPLPKSVPRALAQLIQAMLAKRSTHRPSAQECADLLWTLQ